MAGIDGRKKKHYSAQEMAEGVLGIFFNREKSFNDVEASARMRGEDPMISNTLAYFLKKGSVAAANRALFKTFYTAYRNKQLTGFVAINGMMALAIDGTSCYESRIRHYDDCTEVVRGGVTYYQYRILIASLVNLNTHDAIVVGIEPILNVDGSEKNDCEMNAAKRLLARIKAYNPWMRYVVIADGLYTAAPIINQIKSYKWEAIISLTDERMDMFKVADCRFGNRKKDFFYTENYENNSLWFEGVSLSDFWTAIGDAIPIYAAKREVEEIDEFGMPLKDRPIRTCFFISTIPLSPGNIKRINKLHRARWGIENAAINNLKNGYMMRHVFVYEATALVWVFASLAMNLFVLFVTRNHLRQALPPKTTLAVFAKHIASIFGGLSIFKTAFSLV